MTEITTVKYNHEQYMAFANRQSYLISLC